MTSFLGHNANLFAYMQLTSTFFPYGLAFVAKDNQTFLHLNANCGPNHGDRDNSTNPIRLLLPLLEGGGRILWMDCKLSFCRGLCLDVCNAFEISENAMLSPLTGLLKTLVILTLMRNTPKMMLSLLPFVVTSTAAAAHNKPFHEGFIY